MTPASSESGDREKRVRIWGSFSAENGIFPAAERGRKVVALVVLVKCNFIMLPCSYGVAAGSGGGWAGAAAGSGSWAVAGSAGGGWAGRRWPCEAPLAKGGRRSRSCGGRCSCGGGGATVKRETGENLGEFHGGKRDFSGGRAREESGGVGGFGEVQFHVAPLLQVILLEEKGHVGVVVELILRRGVDVVEGIRAGRDADEDWLAAVEEQPAVERESLTAPGMGVFGITDFQ
nr:hypothetical protein Iba_chr10eCG15040 [Ipomoea batatas]